MAVKYTVFWKGERLGSYTREEIDKEVKFGRFGHFHIVEYPGGGRTPLKHFLENAPGGAEGAPKESAGTRRMKLPAADASPKEKLIAYTLCGICFLHPLLLLPAGSYAAYLAARGKTLLALTAGAAGIAVAVAGRLFFSYILP